MYFDLPQQPVPAKWNTIVKPVSSTSVNFAGVRNDRHLRFTMRPYGYYHIKMKLVIFNNFSSTDLRWGWVLPTGGLLISSVGRHGVGSNSVTHAYLDASGSFTTTITSAGFFRTFIEREGLVYAGIEGGDFNISFGTVFSNSDGATLYAGSYLEYLGPIFDEVEPSNLFYN